MAKDYPIIVEFQIVDPNKKTQGIMNSYDVIIIGRGLSALSTAWHLRRLGIRRLCLVAPNRTWSNCGSYLGHTATVSLHDNITRSVHNLGADVARDLLALSRRGFSQLVDFLQTWNLPHATGQVIRLGLSEHEAVEMEIASKWLSENGFPSGHEKNSTSYSGCHSVQYDGAASVSFDMQELLNRFEKDLKTETIVTTVASLAEQPGCIAVNTSCGKKYHSELVVTACHEGIKNLVPDLASTLVNHADQRIEFELVRGKIPLMPGDHVLAGHGHFWATYTRQKRLIAGGAKFLRKWGGVEAASASVMDNVSMAVKKKWEEVFAIKLSAPISTRGFIELYACDELPVIGPMYGNSRILVASGYRNSGGSFALVAGQSLAEFITTGNSKTLSPRFLPIRLRSLPESK